LPDITNDEMDRNFQAFKARHGDVSFAEFCSRSVYKRVAAGRPHFSLGENLPEDFWQAGSVKAAYYIRKMALAPSHRVIEYGCGSLRIGGHFVRFLEPGNFYGFDVIDGFFEMGKKLIGADLLAAKRPRLAVIAPDAIADAAAFGADHIFSAAVCIHVHPDELQTYFANLTRLASRPGANVFFNVAVADAVVRIRPDSWAHPLSFYKTAMPELELVDVSLGKEHDKTGHTIRNAELHFRRPSPTSFGKTMRSGIAKAMRRLRS
jgi:hypothetical protein